MTCVSSFSFTGLLSRTQSCCAISRKVAGRDITGQDDDRDLAMKLLPQLRGDLQPIHAVRQIVVGKNQVGSDRPARHQFQRRGAVRRRRHSMALFLENKLQESAHVGIVLDRPGCAPVRRAPSIRCRRSRG